MEISQHIKDLLLTHDRVILLGFGAFIAKYKPAKINKENQTMVPPSKEIIFDEKIIKDGGLLENKMAQTEKITLKDAQIQIQEYVKTVKSKLNAGKKVKFVEIGTFSKSTEGLIIFEYQPSANLLLDSYGLQKISLPEHSKTIKEPIKKQRKKAKPIKQQKVKIKSKARTAGDKKPKKRRVGLIVTLLLVALIAIGLFVIYQFKKPLWNTGKEYVTQQYENIFTGDDDTDNENNIVDTSDMTHLSDDTISELTENDTTDTDVSEETVVENNSTNIKPNTSENDTRPVSREDSYVSGNYKRPQKGKSYLIVGSLKASALAEKEKTRLKSLGVNADIILVKNGRYRLSIGNFSSINAATNFYNNFHSSHQNIEVWLWENY